MRQEVADRNIMKIKVPKRRYVTRPIEKNDTTVATSFRASSKLIDEFREKANAYGWHFSMMLALVLEGFLLLDPKPQKDMKTDSKGYEIKTVRLDKALMNALDAWAGINGLSRGQAIIQAITAFNRQS